MIRNFVRRGTDGFRPGVRRRLWLLVCAAALLGCGDDESTSPTPVSPPLALSEIDRLVVFVRDWPDDYVEVDFRQQDGQSTVVMFRPPQPGIPRVLLDSIGPVTTEPAEIVELVNTFNVWAMADSNAAGAACSTRSGEWKCNPTFEDYSLVMFVQSDGVSRAQRYTRLGESGSNATALALGEYVFSWMRRVQASR